MKKFFHLENFRIAFRYIWGNALRTILTVFVIVFGIMALVGMITAVNGLKSSLLNNFSQLGSNSFAFYDKVERGRHGRFEKSPKITYHQVGAFKSKFGGKAIVSAYYDALGNAVVKYKSEKTNPSISVKGADNNYLYTSSLEINRGRNFNAFESKHGSPVAIVGSELKELLFENSPALGKIITVGSMKLRVVGVMKERGSTFGFSYDDMVIMPIQAARKSIPSSNRSFNINVMVDDIETLESTLNEAIGIFPHCQGLEAGRGKQF